MTPSLHALSIALVIGLSGCSTAIADTASRSGMTGVNDLVRPAYKACLKNARGRVEQAPCMAEEQAFQDQQLQAAYQTLSEGMPTAQRSALEQSQTAWKASTEADTRLGVALLDPAGLDLSVTDNTIRLTAQRRQMLEHLISLTR